MNYQIEVKVFEIFGKNGNYRQPILVWRGVFKTNISGKEIAVNFYIPQLDLHVPKSRRFLPKNVPTIHVRLHTTQFSTSDHMVLLIRLLPVLSNMQEDDWIAPCFFLISGAVSFNAKKRCVYMLFLALIVSHCATLQLTGTSCFFLLTDTALPSL